MKTRKWNICVVGCGGMGASHIESFLSMNRANLVSVVDLNENQAKLYQRKFAAKRYSTDCRQEIRSPDIDIVVVSTAPSSHAIITIDALQNGKHVLCEKPLSNSIKGAEDIIGAAKSSNAKILIGHQLRYQQPWMDIIRDLRGGLIGSPILMRMAGNQMTFGKIWEGQKRLIKDTSPLIDCGVHYVDIMRSITGCPAVEVYAQGINLVPGTISLDSYNYGLLQVKFKDNSIGHYEAGWGPMMTLNAWLIKDFSGPKGSLSVYYELDQNTPDKPPNSCSYRVEHRIIPSEKCEWRDTVLDVKTYGPYSCKKGTSLANMHNYFLDAIEKNIDLSGELMSACEALKIVLAADRSIKENKNIKLNGG